MTNGAAIGYAILAAKAMKLSQEQIQNLEGNIQFLLDEVTEEEAEEAYRKS